MTRPHYSIARTTDTRDPRWKSRGSLDRFDNTRRDWTTRRTTAVNRRAGLVARGQQRAHELKTRLAERQRSTLFERGSVCLSRLTSLIHQFRSVSLCLSVCRVDGGRLASVLRYSWVSRSCSNTSHSARNSPRLSRVHRPIDNLWTLPAARTSQWEWSGGRPACPLRIR